MDAGLLWLQDAIGVMGKFLGMEREIKSDHVLFNRTLEWEAFTGITARKAVLQFASDPEMVAAFMPTYLSGWRSMSDMRLAAAGRGIQEKRHTCRFLLTGCLEAGGGLEHWLKSLLEGMKKSWNLCRVFPVVWG